LDEAGFAFNSLSDAAAVLASIDRITIAAAIIDVGLLRSVMIARPGSSCCQ
jgi:hypothetical protein